MRLMLGSPATGPASSNTRCHNSSVSVSLSQPLLFFLLHTMPSSSHSSPSPTSTYTWATAGELMTSHRPTSPARSTGLYPATRSDATSLDGPEPDAHDRCMCRRPSWRTDRCCDPMCHAPRSMLHITQTCLKHGASRATEAGLSRCMHGASSKIVMCVSSERSFRAPGGWSAARPSSSRPARTATARRLAAGRSSCPACSARSCGWRVEFLVRSEAVPGWTPGWQ